jgi:hypothetical protein
MRRIVLTAYFVAAMIMATCLSGCGSATSTGDALGNDDDLQALGVAYHSYHDRHGKGPDSAEDLINMLTDPAKKQDFSNSAACKKLLSGDFVLNPRIQFREAKDLANIPLIYEKQVPTDGGIVVLGDATAKKLTAAEFKQLDKGDDARAEED